MRKFLPALTLLVGIWPAIALVAAAPAADADEVAVVFSPWSTAASRFALLEMAGALPVRSGGAGFVWVVRSDRPGLAGRLRAAGSFLVLDPVAVGGCRTAARV